MSRHIESSVLDGGCNAATPDVRGVLSKDGEFGQWYNVGIARLGGGEIGTAVVKL